MTEIKTLKKIDASSAPKLDAELKAAIDGGELELIINMEGLASSILLFVCYMSCKTFLSLHFSDLSFFCV